MFCLSGTGSENYYVLSQWYRFGRENSYDLYQWYREGDLQWSDHESLRKGDERRESE